MHLYYGGTEIPGWRKLLAEEGVQHVALSYVGLRRRTKFKRAWVLEEKFPEIQSIFLDSGAYTINSADEEKYTVGELRDIASAYMAFVHANLDRVDMVSEFDALVLGRDWIEAMREDFYDDIPEEKFLPIWHPEWGVEELDRLARKYSRVGVPQTAMGGRNLVPTLNALVQKYGTKLHGVAMTKPDVMTAVRWDSVASTSWLSPSQYGDTIVWTGNELKRYPKKYKDQARKRHRTLFTREGFDADKIEADDTTEVLRLTIWSWQQLVANIERKRPADANVVTLFPESADEANAETGGALVDTRGDETRNSRPTIRAREEHEISPLPVMGLLPQKETYVDEDGSRKERSADLVKVRSESMRTCDSCFLASKCPAYEEHANCAYNIPVEIRTKDQQRALQDALIDMQTQRVLFMRMAEDMEGGYADPNLSSEIDRLQRLIKQKHEMEQEGFSLKIEAKERGQGGMISRLFGSDAGEQMRALEAPVQVPSAMEQMGIVDAELVDVPRRDV